MAVDSALYPAALNTTIPTASDFVSEGDDNFRQVKTCLKTTFSNVNGALTATHTEFNYVTGVTSAIQTQLNAKATTAGPTFTGTVTLPATTSIGPVSDVEIGYLDGATSNLQAQINAKGAIAGQAWSGAHSYTGATITVPTVTAGDSSNNAASTAFVAGVAFSSALPGIGGNPFKFTANDGTVALWRYPYLFSESVTGTSVSAVAGKRYRLQNAGATTVTLPASPSDGDVVGIASLNRRKDNVVARNGQNICGLAENMTIGNPYFPLVLEFRTGYGWELVA